MDFVCHRCQAPGCWSAMGVTTGQPDSGFSIGAQQPTFDTNATQGLRRVFDRSDKFGRSQVLNNNLRTPAIHWLDGDARKRHRGQSDTAADNLRMLREKLNQPQCRI